MAHRHLVVGTNAAASYLALLDRSALSRIARALGAHRTGTTPELRRWVLAQVELDLRALLNTAVRAELDALVTKLELEVDGDIGDIRAALWLRGAVSEAGGSELLGGPVQPAPVLLGSKLVLLASGSGVAASPTGLWPRPVPPPVQPIPPEQEPDTLEELLANADQLIGVRLGVAGRNKGAFGARIAALLGVPEHGYSEPDWRGEVEIKTVPVVRDRSGWWRVKEDPAVSMEGAGPLGKLRRVLWIARVADEPDTTVLSWYYQERDASIDRLLRRDLHTRPKGGAGATTRGWYVNKRFFIDSGLLLSLNKESP